MSIHGIAFQINDLRRGSRPPLLDPPTSDLNAKPSKGSAIIPFEVKYGARCGAAKSIDNPENTSKVMPEELNEMPHRLLAQTFDQKGV